MVELKERDQVGQPGFSKFSIWACLLDDSRYLWLCLDIPFCLIISLYGR